MEVNKYGESPKIYNKSKFLGFLRNDEQVYLFGGLIFYNACTYDQRSIYYEIAMGFLSHHLRNNLFRK